MTMRFDQLEAKYGSPVAYALLLQIEKVARISSWAVSSVDFESRLANALRIQDTTGEPAGSLAA